MKVVLLHPLPVDGGIWRDVIARLDHEVIAPSLYALGNSIQEWARAVLALTGAGPLLIVGNSVGGSCAIETARLAPERVCHLVLVGAKAGHRPEPALRDQIMGVLRDQGVEEAWRTYWEPLLGPTASDATRDRLRALTLSQTPEELIRGVSVFHCRPDRTSFLQGWPGPVTIVTGEHDINPPAAQITANRLRQGSFVLLEGVGHYAPAEAPAALAAVVARATRDVL